MTAPGTTDEVKAQLDQFRADFEALRREVGKVIVGLSGIVDDTLTALIAGGHVLLEGGARAWRAAPWCERRLPTA